MDEDDVSVERSNKAEVRNPLLALVSARKLQALPKESRDALRALLLELRASAHEKAEHSWRKRKGPLAVYWRCVAVYAGHISRLLRDPQPQKAARSAREEHACEI
jgi:hypothetical protein